MPMSTNYWLLIIAKLTSSMS